jgi:FkbM family methyltransferase
MMADAEILKRFRACLKYQRAQPWQKPLLDPRRFVVNQLKKRGLLRQAPGSLSTTATFCLPEFTVVEGELVSQEVASYGLYEPELTEAFLHLVQTGQVVLDVGMHLGYYTTLFAVLVGKEGQVHSFEPTPSTRQIAERNTSRFPQVRVHPVALWSSAGILRLRDYGLRYMGFNTLVGSKLHGEPAPPKEIEVQTITLDQFRSSLAKDRPVALLKIDAEAAERDIIAGAHELIARDRPLISVEVGDKNSTDESRSLAEALIALQYAPWEFVDGAFKPHQVQRSYLYGNLIFAPQGVDLRSVS